MEEISPENCLIRICRICHKTMELSNYEFDSEYRWYTFFCDNCEITSVLGEMINEDYRDEYEEEDGIQLDPLTESEQAEQDSANNIVNERTKGVHKYNWETREDNK